MLRLHVCWLIIFQDCREAPLTSIEHESISVVFRLTIRYQEHMSECRVELISFVGRWSLRRTWPVTQVGTLFARAASASEWMKLAAIALSTMKLNAGARRAQKTTQANPKLETTQKHEAPKPGSEPKPTDSTKGLKTGLEISLPHAVKPGHRTARSSKPQISRNPYRLVSLREFPWCKAGLTGPTRNFGGRACHFRNGFGTTAFDKLTG